MKVEVSNGELVDKVTILELKLSNITDTEKLINIKKEFDELNPLLEELFNKFPPLIQHHYLELTNVNSQLWEIEDDIRECELKSQFDDIFIELARSVYITNDRRCEIKKKINILTNSGFIEEKSYQDYQ
jgi:hypothetical protein|tara:strand:+ start:3109 stop:3495 length:387 start_codon:yes stop_codon:yes gene_type:complete